MTPAPDVLATILVGETPTRTSDPERVFDGRSMRWMCALANTNERSFRERVRCVNLFPTYPGRFWSLQARTRASDLLRRVAPHDTLVFMGRRVALAFGISPKAPYMSWFAFRGGTACVFPHPSGRSRWWNEPEQRERAAVFLREQVLGLEPLEVAS